MRSKTLTPKQEAFAVAVAVEGLSLADAYRKAYNAKAMTDKSIHEAASKLLANDMVRPRVDELRQRQRESVVTDRSMTIQRLKETYEAIALVDPNELISVRVGCCRHCYGEGFGYQWREREYLRAVQEAERAEKPLPDYAGGFGHNHTLAPVADCPECHGEGVERIVPKDTTLLSPGAKLLYRGVQRTKDGIKILFRDQDKALDQIGRMLGAYDDKLRVDVEAKVASLKLTTSDPNEAAQAYQKMLGG